MVNQSLAIGAEHEASGTNHRCQEITDMARLANTILTANRAATTPIAPEAPVRNGAADATPALSRIDTISTRRSTILMEIVRDFCQLERPDQADISRFKEIFYQLIQSVGIVERRSLSASLAACHYVPRTVVLFLAMDELEVAAPVLLFSPVINESDIISLARRMDIEHLKVLARREALTSDGARALRHAGGREVAAILARNRSLVGSDNVEAVPAPVVPPVISVSPSPQIHASDAVAGPLPLPTNDSAARELVDLAGRGGRLGRGRQEEAQATRKEIPTQPSEKSIAAGRELLEAHRNGAAEGFISAAAYRTGVRAAIIRAMVEKLDGESLAVLLKGMAVEDLEAMQLFVRLLPQVGRDFAKYKSLQAMYRKLNGERCKLAMLALSGTRLTPEHTNEPKAPSARLMEVAAQRRASLHQHADPKPLTGERSPPRSFNRLARS